MASNSGNTHTFLADAPIESADQDRFGRVQLAQHLADHILAYRSKESLVVALHGEWGSGKSSLLNLIADVLADDQSPNAPFIVRFNPWNFLGTDDLLRAFFSAIKGDGTVSWGSRAADALDQLAWLAAVGSVTPAAPVSGIMAGVFKWGARVTRGEPKSGTPEQLKTQIGAALSKLGRRLVVMIDDIDRLEADSLLTMLRLVKLTAGFDGTTYVLAYDPLSVDKTLELTKQMTSGRDYLEKIVQVSFDVPNPDPAALRRMFLEAIHRSIAEIPDSDWENDRWQELYYDGLRPLIKTPRAVVRFSNSIGMNLRLLPGELNPIDQIGLEAIRVFAPGTHRFLRDNKNLILGPETHGALGSEDKAAVGEQLAIAWRLDGAEAAGAVEAIAKHLLPQISRVSSSQSSQTNVDRLAHRRRIASREFYDRYFLLKVPEGEISESEVATVLALQDVDSLVSHLQALIDGERIGRFLERLEVAAEGAQPEFVEPMTVALFSVADQLPMESEQFLGFGQQLQLARVLLRLIRTIPSNEERVRIIREAVSATDALGSVVYQVSMFDHADGFDEASLAKLRDLVLVQIRAAVERDDLHKTYFLGDTLFRWRDWVGDDEPTQYVAHLIETDDGLVTFLEGMATEVKTTSGRGYQTRIDVRHSTVAILTPVAPLIERAGKILSDGIVELSTRQKVALEGFLSHQGRDGVDDFLQTSGPESTPETKT